MKKVRVTRYETRKESLDLSKRPLNSKRRQQRANFPLLVYSHPASTHSVVIPESRNEISGICLSIYTPKVNVRDSLLRSYLAIGNDG